MTLTQLARKWRGKLVPSNTLEKFRSNSFIGASLTQLGLHKMPAGITKTPAVTSHANMLKDRTFSNKARRIMKQPSIMNQLQEMDNATGKAKIRGKILYPSKHSASAWIDNTRDIFDTPPISHTGRRDANFISLAHEADETRRTKHTKFLGSHNSPAVILREHNNLTRLETPSAPETRKLFKHLRDREGTAPAIDATVPELGYAHGESSRLSRHAIRRISDLIDKKQRQGINQLLRDA